MLRFGLWPLLDISIDFDLVGACQAAQDYGMGPRGSALICGYTTYHKLVEESLARLKKKEVSIDVFRLKICNFGSLSCSGSAGLPSLPHWIFCQHGCNYSPGEYYLSFVPWKKTCRARENCHLLRCAEPCFNH
jgi:hypothetical protein